MNKLITICILVAVTLTSCTTSSVPTRPIKSPSALPVHLVVGPNLEYTVKLTSVKPIVTPTIQRHLPGCSVFAASAIMQDRTVAFTDKPFIVLSSGQPVLLIGMHRVAEFLSDLDQQIPDLDAARARWQLMVDILHWTPCEGIPDDLAQWYDENDPDQFALWRPEETVSDDSWTFTHAFLTDSSLTPRQYDRVSITIWKSGATSADADKSLTVLDLMKDNKTHNKVTQGIGE